MGKHCFNIKAFNLLRKREETVHKRLENLMEARKKPTHMYTKLPSILPWRETTLWTPVLEQLQPFITNGKI